MESGGLHACVSGSHTKIMFPNRGEIKPENKILYVDVCKQKHCCIQILASEPVLLLFMQMEEMLRHRCKKIFFKCQNHWMEQIHVQQLLPLFSVLFLLIYPCKVKNVSIFLLALYCLKILFACFSHFINIIYPGPVVNQLRWSSCSRFTDGMPRVV